VSVMRVTFTGTWCRCSNVGGWRPRIRVAGCLKPFLTHELIEQVIRGLLHAGFGVLSIVNEHAQLTDLLPED
jgi:hypothetical protein